MMNIGRSTLTLLGTHPVRPSRHYPHVKAVVDLTIGSVLFVLTLPVVLIAAALVRLTSSGPAFYKQVRVGRGGRLFTLYKLRSMDHDCERLSGPQWSCPGDPRVTPLGWWLRKTHIDELPQLWNVVRREMSLIGPRPERPCFVTQLERAIPHYADRLLVRPGITGLAQVLLPPDENADDVRIKLSYDRIYISAMGAQIDLKILLATILKVVGVPFDVTRRVLALPGATPAAPPPADPSTIPTLESAPAGL